MEPKRWIGIFANVYSRLNTDVVTFAEHAFVVGFEFDLRRRQRWTLRIVNQIENEAALLAP